MKLKLLILFIFLTYPFGIKAQWNSEFDYFSFSAGVTHNFGVFHEVGQTTNAYFTNVTYEQLISENKYDFRYKPSVNIGIYYHHDLQNDDMGFSTGIEYHNFSFKSKFLTEISGYTLFETSSFRTLSVPIFFKYGKKFYEPQRYVFAGAKLNYHLTGKLFYEYNHGHTTYELSRDQFSKLSPSFFIGFNYRIFNVKIEYLLNNPIIENPLEIEHLSDNDGFAKQLIFLNTNINIPTGFGGRNPWFKKINLWYRRLF